MSTPWSPEPAAVSAQPPRGRCRCGIPRVCAARRIDRLTALADEISGTAVECDVTDEAQVAALAQAVGDTLDVLVNNAGGALGADPVIEGDPDQWRRMYDINVIGTMQVTKALTPALIAGGAGTIINIGSTAGALGVRGWRRLHRGQARRRGAHRDPPPGAQRAARTRL